MMKYFSLFSIIKTRYPKEYLFDFNLWKDVCSIVYGGKIVWVLAKINFCRLSGEKLSVLIEVFNVTIVIYIKNELNLANIFPDCQLYHWLRQCARKFRNILKNFACVNGHQHQIKLKHDIKFICMSHKRKFPKKRFEARTDGQVNKQDYSGRASLPLVHQ